MSDPINVTGTFERARAQELNELLEHLEFMAAYIDDYQLEKNIDGNLLEDLTEFIVEKQELETDDILFIMKRVSDRSVIPCGTGGRLFEGMIRNVSW